MYEQENEEKNKRIEQEECMSSTRRDREEHQECAICFDPLSTSPNSPFNSLSNSPFNSPSNSPSSSASSEASHIEQIYYKLPCGHAFHLTCMMRWFDIQMAEHRVPDCPICRRKLDYVELGNVITFSQKNVWKMIKREGLNISSLSLSSWSRHISLFDALQSVRSANNTNLRHVIDIMDSRENENEESHEQSENRHRLSMVGRYIVYIGLMIFFGWNIVHVYGEEPI